MKSVQKHLASLMLLLSWAAAQTAGTATVQSLKTVREGSDLRVEIILNAAVIPTVDTAQNPDRILLDFPDTTCNENTKSLAVNANGIRRVRTGQHSTSPMVTRVVIDLDQAHPYTMKAEGNRVILTVGAAETANRRSAQGAPVAATSGNLIGIFRKPRESRPVAISPDESADNTPIPPPPATSGPAFEPPSANSAASLPAPPPSVARPQQVAPAAAGQNSAPQPSADQSQIAVTKAEEPVLSPPQPPAQVRPPSVAPVPAPVIAKNEEPPAATRKMEIAPVTQTTAQPPAVDPAAVQPPVNSEGAPVPVPKAEAPLSAATPKVEDVAPPKSEKPASVAPEPAPASSPVAEARTVIARSDDPSLRTVFKVKYVAEGVAYLDGGSQQGLKEGMKLEIEDINLPAKQGDSVHADDPRVIAELEVSAVADTSAVTDIQTPKRPVKVGDLAYLSSGDADAMVQQRALSATRQYPAVIAFTEGDTLDEEALAVVPRPPMPSVNRARGRIGLDTIETLSHGTTSVTSSDVGIAFRGDITRIGGTYWNLSGYWRGRLTKESAASQQTLQSLINRTYHLNMTYDNPNSAMVAGFGRLYLPWAPSLDTIDGGYFGARLGHGSTLGLFGGSTPDPSSWDYAPNRAIGGMFINFEGGEYDGFHYSSTAGAGVSLINWAIDRPFVFVEDSVSYKRTIALYESAQLDSPAGTPATPAPGPGLGRNFLTFRVNPVQRVELNFNYNYFRDVPTFDATLVGTGLLDKFLFQGFSAGGRVEIFKQIWVSSTLGRSSRSGDAKASLNEMYGLTFGRLPFLKIRTDAHYARFNSSFGTGSYESLSFSRQMSDRLRLELLLGQQRFASPITTDNRARFLTGTIETTLGPHYYLQSSFTTNRGDLSYDQLMFSMGYRFDSKRRGE